MKLKFLFLSLILCANTLLSSIISGTFIKTPSGYQSVENITIGDSIISYDNYRLNTSTVTHISKTITNTLIAITTAKGIIYATLDQQFFDPVFHQWFTAKDITTKNTILDSDFNYCACLNVEIIHISDTKIYNISTTQPHNFFATEQELLIHNAFPLVIGFAWAFGSGIKFAGLTLGTAIFGSYVGVKLYNKQKQKEKDFDIVLQVTSNGYTPDPDDDKNKERKFNPITKTEFFQKVEKHYQRWRGNTYKRKPHSKGIEDAEYLEWDYTHNDVEAYGKNRWHLGSINPQNLKIYKPAVPGRKIPK